MKKDKESEIQEDFSEHSGNNQPEKRFVASPVVATVWLNRKKEELGTFRTISLSRNYKDKEGSWQSTNTFRVNDLPKAMVALNKAYEYLILKGDGHE